MQALRAYDINMYSLQKCDASAVDWRMWFFESSWAKLSLTLAGLYPIAFCTGGLQSGNAAVERKVFRQHVVGSQYHCERGSAKQC